MRVRALLAAAAVAASIAGAGTNVVVATATADCPFCDICVRDPSGYERACLPVQWPPRIELPPQG